MKKRLLVLFLLLFSVSFLMSEQVENVVLLDTSESMFRYFSGTVEYLIEDITKNQLQSGDSFHLLSFNDFPEYEISRTIRGEEEIGDILSRILLLQPVGKYTDLISAFSYLFEYVKDLSLSSIKRIIILTDGIHDPPPGSPYPVSPDNISYITKISEEMKRMGWDVLLVRFPLDGNVIDNSDGSGSVKSSEGQLTTIDLSAVIAQASEGVIVDYDPDKSSLTHAATGAPEIIYPDNLGTVPGSFHVNFKIVNHSSDPVLLKLDAILLNDNNILDKKVTLKLEKNDTGNLEVFINMPINATMGQNESEIELIFSDDFRAYPRRGILKYYYDPDATVKSSRINKRILLYILVGVVILAALIYLLTIIFRSFNSPVRQFASGEKTSKNYIGYGKNTEEKTYKETENNLDAKINTITKNSITATTKSGKKGSTKTESDQETFKNKSYTKDQHDTAKSKNRFSNYKGTEKPGQLTVEMIARNQNRRVGHRNIHLLEEGHPRLVGGSGSEYFLIFIIATGKRIAEITIENDSVTFIPKSKEFFPYFIGEKLIDCLNKPIVVRNVNGMETSIMFKKWTSPVERINRVMHLLDEKGMPEFEY